MTSVNPETKLYIKDQIDKIDKEHRSRTHSIKSDITNSKFELESRIKEEREISDKKYAPAWAGKVMGIIGAIFLSAIVGAIIKSIGIG